MIRHLARYVDNHRFPFQMANTFIYAWECDYWAMDLHGITREFEIKISRSDFFADAKKSKHRLHGDHGANYFYYVVPQYLIQPGEVDKKYGLLYIDKTGCVDLIRRPIRLHDRVFDQWRHLATKLHFRYQSLWREKYIDGEITLDQYLEGKLTSQINNDGQ